MTTPLPPPGRRDLNSPAVLVPALLSGCLRKHQKPWGIGRSLRRWRWIGQRLFVTHRVRNLPLQEHKPGTYPTVFDALCPARSPPWLRTRSCPPHPPRTRCSVPTTRRSRHSNPWLSPDDAWGRDARTPFLIPSL